MLPPVEVLALDAQEGEHLVHVGSIPRRDRVYRMSWSPHISRLTAIPQRGTMNLLFGDRPGQRGGLFAMSQVIYFDHAATTPLHPQVLEAMLPYLGERFGNPSGTYALAREAQRALA